ncbi:MAG: hypothetical protein ACLR7Z_18485 [Bilophila wadsworthia]
MAGLNLTKNVSGTTQPQIFHRNLEARAQVIHIKNNAQTFFCCSRQPLQIRNNETGKSLPIGPPHPAPQLVQLPQTEKMRLIDDQRIGPRVSPDSTMAVQTRMSTRHAKMRAWFLQASFPAAAHAPCRYAH